MIATCRGFISTNEEVSFILCKVPFLKKRFTEIPIGSNIVPPPGQAGKRLEFRKNLGFDDEVCVLSNFGLFYPGKGLSTLLECCSILMQREFSFFLMLLSA